MTKQYLDYAGLREYDAKIKAWVEARPQPEIDLTEIREELADLYDLVGDAPIADQIEEAISQIVDDAPAAFDTLKEISDWISQHGAAASALVESVAALGEKVDEVESKVDSIIPISTSMIEALFLEPVELEEGQTVQAAIAALEEGQKLVLTDDVAENLNISSDVVIEAEGVDFSGTITVSESAAVTIIGATFSGEVVVQ